MIWQWSGDGGDVRRRFRYGSGGGRFRNTKIARSRRRWYARECGRCDHRHDGNRVDGLRCDRGGIGNVRYIGIVVLGRLVGVLARGGLYRPFGRIVFGANFEGAMHLQLIGLSDGAQHHRNVGAQCLDAMERCDQSDRQIALGVHFATQKEVALQVIVAEIVFTAMEQTMERLVSACESLCAGQHLHLFSNRFLQTGSVHVCV